MGIFNRRGGEKYSRGRNVPDNRTGWEDMDARSQNVAPEQQRGVESQDARRQQRKIISVFANSGDGVDIDTKIIDQHDVEVSDSEREDVLDRLADGRITEKQKRQLIDSICGPLDIKGGSERIINEMVEKRERRILSSMSGRGFDSWQAVDASDLATFIKQYPNPADFERDSAVFLDMIESYNGKSKHREYEQAMASFKLRVYGKKMEYLDQMHVLEHESEQKRIVRQIGARSHRMAQMDQHPARNVEHERSSEWQFGEAGYWQTSRMQAARGEVSRDNIDRGLWADNSCEDSMFICPNQQMFGVFDGAGGERGGRLASQLTVSVVREYSDRYALDNCSSLAYVLNAANERVSKNPAAGLSTAVLAKVIDRNGRKMLAYASVGDSRIYIVDRVGNARLITHDEGEGRYIYNAIGMKAEQGESRTAQFGEVDLHRGDRVVLCSDGITGDYGDDLMSERELGAIVSKSRGAQEASKNLLSCARKRDDRTAIVFGEYE